MFFEPKVIPRFNCARTVRGVLVAGWAALAFGGCQQDHRSSLLKVDTLPGGVVRVISAGATAWEGSSGWRLEPLSAIDPPAGSEGELINPTALAFAADDRLFVSDGGPPSIKVFDTAGRFVRRIGREGEGPGEFRSAAATVVGPIIVVHDPKLQRTTLLDTTGAYRTSWPSTCCAFGKPIGLENGRLAIPAVIPYDSTGRISVAGYIDFDSAGVPHDSVALPTGPIDNTAPRYWSIKKGGKNGTMSGAAAIPFLPSYLSVRLGNGSIAAGFTGQYQIAEGRRRSDTTRIFGRVWTPVPISDQQRRDAIEETVAAHVARFDEAELRKVFRLEDVPKTSPAFTAIMPDGAGNLWIRVPTERDLTTTTLDVFDRDRAYLGQVVVADRWPGYFRAAWGRDVVAVQMETTDGRPYLARYRVVRR